MIRALLGKEVRLQAPFVALVLLFALLGWLDVLISSPVERMSSERLADLVSSDEASDAIPYFLLIFSLAVGLLVREIDERTQEWIDALPVSRARVFLVKVCFAIGFLSLIPLSSAVLGAVSFGLNQTSLRSGIPWSWIAGGALISLVQVMFFFALGLVLSFLRPFAWIGFGLLFWAYQLTELFVPSVSLLEPFRLGHNYLRITPVTFPGTQCSILLLLSSVFLAIAFFAFVRREDRGTPDVTPDRWKRWGLRALVPLTIVLVISTIGFVIESEPQETPGKVSSPKGTVAHGKTRRYEMTYPSTLADRARVLLTEADRVHDAVALALGVVDAATIAVDAHGARRGTAGNAAWTKVRLDLTVSDDPQTLAAILGHETAHVYISRLSDEAVDQDPSGPFFHEGLATFLEYSLFHQPDELLPSRVFAAAIHQRQQIKFETLLNNSALNEHYATEVAYPLGERFFASLIERHGIEAAHRILSVLGDPAFPRKTSGIDRWRIMFQSAGYDLEDEVAAWTAALKADQKTYATFIDDLPRLIPQVSQLSGRLIFSLQEEVPEGLALGCRFRKDANAPEAAWHYVSMRNAASCWINEDALPKPFQYQLGLIEPGTDRQLWEPWETLH